eukprot:gene15113-21169_t
MSKLQAIMACALLATLQVVPSDCLRELRTAQMSDDQKEEKIFLDTFRAPMQMSSSDDEEQEKMFLDNIVNVGDKEVWLEPPPTILRRSLLASEEPQPWSFVKRDGVQFVVGSESSDANKTIRWKPFYFLGYNAFWMTAPPSVPQRLGMTVARCWAFNSKMPEAPGIYDEDQMQGLDFLVYAAAKYNTRLVMVLGNLWPAYFGPENWLIMADGPWTEGKNILDFYNSSGVRTLYKQHISYMTNRTNVYTGIKYKDDPTIMAWNVMNEPRCPGCMDAVSQDIVIDFMDDLSTHLRNEDPNHLITMGTEGMFMEDTSPNQVHFFNPGAGGQCEGQDWTRIRQLPNIDQHIHLPPSPSILTAVLRSAEHGDSLVGAMLWNGAHNHTDDQDGYKVPLDKWPKKIQNPAPVLDWLPAMLKQYPSLLPPAAETPNTTAGSTQKPRMRPPLPVGQVPPPGLSPPVGSAAPPAIPLLPDIVVPTTTPVAETVVPTTTPQTGTVVPTTTPGVETVVPTTTPVAETVTSTATPQTGTMVPKTTQGVETVVPATTPGVETVVPATTPEAAAVVPTTTTQTATVVSPTTPGAATVVPTTTTPGTATVVPTATPQAGTVVPTTTSGAATVVPTTTPGVDTVVPTTTPGAATEVPTTPPQTGTVVPTTTPGVDTVVPTTTPGAATEVPTTTPQTGTVVPTIPGTALDSTTEQTAVVEAAEGPLVGHTRSRRLMAYQPDVLDGFRRGGFREPCAFNASKTWRPTPLNESTIPLEALRRYAAPLQEVDIIKHYSDAVAEIIQKTEYKLGP